MTYHELTALKIESCVAKMALELGACSSVYVELALPCCDVVLDLQCKLTDLVVDWKSGSGHILLQTSCSSMLVSLFLYRNVC